MRKYIKNLLVCLLFPLFLMSCNSSFINTIKTPFRLVKPSEHFYTDALIRNLKSSKDITISIFYPKTGKNKTIPEEYMEKFYLFLDLIEKEDFVRDLHGIDVTSPEYRLTVYINDKSSFIINLLNDRYITIHPWDGSYAPDIIDISSLHTGNNIFNVVDYLVKNYVKK